MRVNGRQISLMAVDKRSTRMEADIMVSSWIIVDMEKGY
jgi:hypothetical protein